MNYQGSNTTTQPVSSAALTNVFLRSVYNWMGFGLGITATLSLLFTYTDLYYLLFSPQGIALAGICLVAEFALVFGLSFFINKISGKAAAGIFIVYSILNGVTLSIIIGQYQTTSVASAFITTAAMFGAMSIYGLTTKRDLSGIGSLLIMGLFGLIIAMVVNLFMQSTMVEFGISVIGIIIFLGLTAYDNQLLKEMGESVPQDDVNAVQRATIMGALRLYLDFINLFIMLLRLIGDRR